jgi:glycosyltransferase involved in cell wall biosynthesis
LLTNKDIIVISDDWGRHPFSCQHIMKHFLPQNRLLWVQTIGMRRPKLNFNDAKRSVQKLRSYFSRPVSQGKRFPDNLTVVDPFMLPFGNSLVRAVNRRSVIRAVRCMMNKLDFKKPIVITTLPNAADYLGSFGETVSVYYCVDEFSEWPGVNKQLVANMERKLLRQVDLVVAVSEGLRRNKNPANGSSVRLLTHGVDAEHFSRATKKTSNDMAILAMGGIPEPIVGYFGLFDERSDQKMLEHLLKKRPDWSLVVIGKAAVGCERLSRYPNFHYREAVSYDDLPDFVSYFSVCILPYVRSVLTDNINPLKLKEYLATGKPIVSTALPEAIKLAPLVRIAGNPTEFVNEVESSIIGSSASLEEIQVQLRGESWEAKAECFAAMIAEAKQAKSCAVV